MKNDTKKIIVTVINIIIFIGNAIISAMGNNGIDNSTVALISSVGLSCVAIA